LVPPRAAAVRFWELEIGKPSAGPPSIEEVRAALCDRDPGRRAAASLYVEASLSSPSPQHPRESEAHMNYTTLDLIGGAEGPNQAIWTALGVKDALWRDSDEDFFGRLMPRLPRLREDLRKIKDPGLALLTSLQLTREKQDTGQLDEFVGKHVFSATEIAAIKPDVERMARSSMAVREKLRQMRPQVPEFSPGYLAEMGETNYLALVLPRGK
jgi:hypothetical protein